MPKRPNDPDIGRTSSAQKVDRELAGRFDAFMHLADQVAMPDAERAGILGVSVVTLGFGPQCLHGREAEGLRRLEYAITLLERLVANMKQS